MRIPTRSAVRVLCAVLAAIPLLFSTLRAQEAPRVERGTRVRFSIQTLDTHLAAANESSSVARDVHMAYVRTGRVTATVLSSDADTVVVQLSRGGAQLALPWESFEWMEERGSRTRATVISTLVGAVAAGASLAYLGAAVWEELDPPGCDWYGCRPNRWNSRSETAIQLGLRGAVVGGAIGYVIGARGTFDSWKPVPVRGRVAVVPTYDGLSSLSASARF